MGWAICNARQPHSQLRSSPTPPGYSTTWAERSNDSGPVQSDQLDAQSLTLGNHLCLSELIVGDRQHKRDNKMKSRREILLHSVAAASLLALPGAAFAQGNSQTKGPPGNSQGQGKGNKNHKNGKDLLGAQIKQNGNHHLDTVANIDVSVDVNGGKIVGLHAKHPQKGELQIGKVKSMQMFAALDPNQQPFTGEPRVELAQVLVTVWYYAYWFTDDNGNNWYYWYPVDYIVDDGSWFVYAA
jgi:hypothetical protein